MLTVTHASMRRSLLVKMNIVLYFVVVMSSFVIVSVVCVCVFVSILSLCELILFIKTPAIQSLFTRSLNWNDFRYTYAAACMYSTQNKTIQCHTYILQIYIYSEFDLIKFDLIYTRANLCIKPTQTRHMVACNCI